MKQTVLFIGLGSIGTRHLNNLRELCANKNIEIEVHALRSDISRPLRDGVAEKVDVQFTSLSDLKALSHYDIAFLTNPTAYHAEMLTALKGKVGTWFIEKPIVTAEQAELSQQNLFEHAQKAYVAAPMRWCGAMLALRKWLCENENAKPYSARVICSSYLPDWRKGVDYRTVYSAKKALGGGVTIDLIHEWDYLVSLFGKPEEIFNFKGTYSELEIDSDDLSIYIARYKNMLCEVHLDYFGREYRRSIELFTKLGTITADFGLGTLVLPNGEKQDYSEDVNERYIREMDYFLNYALNENGESQNPPSEAFDVLRLCDGKLSH